MMQKRALRMIYNKKMNSHTDPLFRRCGILKLSDIYQLEVLLFMHDYLNNRLPMSFNNVFPLNSDNANAYSTRQIHMFSLPRTKSRFVDRLPMYQYPTLWNNHPLTNTTALELSRNSLKRKVKDAFLNDYSAVVNCLNPCCPECGQ